MKKISVGMVFYATIVIIKTKSSRVLMSWHLAAKKPTMRYGYILDSAIFECC